MIGILVSALVVAAVAAFLVWAVHYRAQQHTADKIVHTQLTAIRAALRDAGIPVHDDPPKPKPHRSDDTDRNYRLERNLTPSAAPRPTGAHRQRGETSE